jgi:hypothetical protein
MSSGINLPGRLFVKSLTYYLNYSTGYFNYSTGYFNYSTGYFNHSTRYFSHNDDGSGPQDRWDS